MTRIPGCLLLVVLFTWNASLASAQNAPCDSSQFDTLTNMWRLEPDQNTREVSVAELAAERRVMRPVVQMFKSAFVPTGAVGYYSVNYDILPHVVTNKSRYGNTYVFMLSNQKLRCRSGKPVMADISLGMVSVHVNTHFIGEAENGDSRVGFSYLPRGYYQRKEKLALPEANAEGFQEFNFGDGTTVWWFTRPGALPFRYVTRREFLHKQIEIVRGRSTPSPELLAYYQELLSDATDDVAFIKQADVPGLTERGYVFTTLEDRANRVCVTVNPDYYDRSLPKSAPQHMMIRLKRESVEDLNRTGNGPRHLAAIQQLREIVVANLPAFRSIVK